MTRRLLPTALLLAAGYVALLVFLGALGRIFQDEREGALQELAARRQALGQYARVALAQRLHERLAAAEPRIDAAIADPLIDSEGTLYVNDTERVLPLTAPHPVPHPSLADDDEASETPFVAAVRAAKDGPALEKAVRALLQHRARWRVPVTHDCEAVTQVVETLLGRASEPLLKGLLRDGFQGQDGLQRELLRARGQLEPAGFQRWCTLIAALSRRANVPSDDFVARCELEPVEKLSGDWYSERVGSITRGVAYDRTNELAILAQQMQQRGLIEDTDTLAHDPPDVVSARWSVAEKRAEDLFRLKAGLLAFSAALGLVLLLVALVAQRRKLRFVEMKEDFVSAVSHELKTPLASMRVMAETLELRLEGNAAAKDYPQRLVSEVDALHALVENILSFNRLDKGRWTPHRSHVALSTLQTVLEEDARSWPQPVTLTFEGFASKDATLNADAELLKLCLLNLLRNACRYNTRSPIEIAFTFDGRVLRVRDNGIGIPAEQHERVFEEFVRLKSASAPARAGTGLGLALCRRVMSMHQGSIAIESSSPAGTLFALRF
jgi:two-component system sensor histidine kinase SenX3